MLIVWVVGLMFSGYLSLEFLIILFLISLASHLLSPVLFSNVSFSMSILSASNSSYILMGLTLLVFMLSLGAGSSYFLSLRGRSYSMLLGGMFLSVIIFFSVSSVMWFYIFFELSVIPIFIIIMGWGYQSERLGAALSMFFYTLLASLPFLGGIMYLGSVFSSSSFLLMGLLSAGTKTSLFSFIFLFAFLVKLPMYLVHLWLPKAHVEAPVSGSMILAAILLKLGGFGILVLLPLSYFLVSIKMFVSISVIGMVIVNFICLRLSDMKMIIAYSSVGHMSMVVFSFMSVSKQGLVGGFFMLVAHGFVSSAMFFSANLMYEKSHSRSLILNKGLLTFNWSLAVFWFLVLSMNMAAPPSLNFFSEIFVIMSLLNDSMLNSFPIFITVMTSAGYSLLLFSSSCAGQPLVLLTTSSTPSKDVLNLMVHVSWGILSILGMSSMI